MKESIDRLVTSYDSSGKLKLVGLHCGHYVDERTEDNRPVDRRDLCFPRHRPTCTQLCKGALK